MFAANTYRIRIATDEDTDTLNRLAAHRALRPLEGRVLIGERNGTPAAALSLGDGRVIADDSPSTDHLIANLRIRAISIWAQESNAPLPERMQAGLPAWYRATALPTSAEASTAVEREPVGAIS
jgi:hypothetical protein